MRSLARGMTRWSRIRRPSGTYHDRVNLEFSSELWFWKGPAPWHFITVERLDIGDVVTVRLSLDV